VWRCIHRHNPFELWELKSQPNFAPPIPAFSQPNLTHKEPDLESKSKVKIKTKKKKRTKKTLWWMG
jgi:hypothetical protein